MTVQWLGTPAPRSINWLGQTGCVTPPCPGGTIKQYDPTCISGTVRCVPGTFESCPEDMALSPKGRCVPIRCPTGTVRNDRDECQVVVRPRATTPADYCVLPPLSFLSQETIGRFAECWNGQCSPEEFLVLVSDLNTLFQTASTSNQPAIVAQIQFARDLLVTGGASKCPSTTPPAPPPPGRGGCLTTQQVVSMAPCFYLDPATGAYSGPPELVQGVDLGLLRSFCFRSEIRLPNGCLDLLNPNLPLCDTATLPAPPSCITPEQRRLLTYCAERSYCGDDPVANYFCWFALKAPDKLLEWVRTPDCAPGQVPVPPPAPPSPPQPPTAPAPAAQSGSLAVPLLIGAAIVAGVALLMSA